MEELVDAVVDAVDKRIEVAGIVLSTDELDGVRDVLDYILSRQFALDKADD